VKLVERDFTERELGHIIHIANNANNIRIGRLESEIHQDKLFEGTQILSRTIDKNRFDRSAKIRCSF
jgi:hypothetical protein